MLKYGSDLITGDTMDPEPITADILMLTHRIATEYAVNDESSLSDAVRDMGTLEYIADKAQTFDSNIDRAAWLLWSVSTMHPFVEGNKRTALLSCQYALRNRRFQIDGRENILNRDIRDITSGNRGLDGVKQFIVNNSIAFNQNGVASYANEDLVRMCANESRVLLMKLSE